MQEKATFHLPIPYRSLSVMKKYLYNKKPIEEPANKEVKSPANFFIVAFLPNYHRIIFKEKNTVPVTSYFMKQHQASLLLSP